MSIYLCFKNNFLYSLRYSLRVQVAVVILLVSKYNKQIEYCLFDIEKRKIK